MKTKFQRKRFVNNYMISQACKSQIPRDEGREQSMDMSERETATLFVKLVR